MKPARVWQIGTVAGLAVSAAMDRSAYSLEKFPYTTLTRPASSAALIAMGCWSKPFAPASYRCSACGMSAKSSSGDTT